MLCISVFKKILKYNGHYLRKEARVFDCPIYVVFFPSFFNCVYYRKITFLNSVYNNYKVSMNLQ